MFYFPVGAEPTWPDMVAHAWDPGIQEAEAGELPVLGHYGLHRKTMSRYKQNNTYRMYSDIHFIFPLRLFSKFTLSMWSNNCNSQASR